MGEATVMLTNKCVIDRAIIDALPNLRYIGELATGCANIDIALRRLKVLLSNIPAYSTESVVQHVFALILEIFGAGTHDASVKNGTG